MTAPPPSTITPHIFAIVLFLTIAWGVYVVFTVSEYVRVRGGYDRRRSDSVSALRKVIVALCVWALPVAFLLRTGAVLLGLGNEVAGQIVFFALVGTNVPGSIVVVASVWYEWRSRRVP